MKQEKITLQDIKERKIDESSHHIKWMKSCLDPWNINVYRNRMAEKRTLLWNIHDMTHDGNDPKSNERMLDDAKVYYDSYVYTDEEWEEYFIPAINEAIERNNSFVRWMPGYVIKNKEGRLFIVEYDYNLAFGHLSGGECRDFTSLSVCTLNDNQEITGSWAWAEYGDYELVDSEHTEENIAKIREYHKGGNPPYYLRSKLCDMYYR